MARAKLAGVSLGGTSGAQSFFLSASGIKAQVDTTCPPLTPSSRPTNTGSGGVASLTINGMTQDIAGTPNQVIPIPAVGTLTVNYQQQTGSGLSQASPKLMTRRALYLDIVTSNPTTHPLGAALGPILGDNVVIAEAISGFEGVQNPARRSRSRPEREHRVERGRFRGGAHGRPSFFYERIRA
jgi:hypothetical protein